MSKSLCVWKNYSIDIMKVLKMSPCMYYLRLFIGIRVRQVLH